jgi:hypothetical protein
MWKVANFLQQEARIPTFGAIESSFAIIQPPRLARDDSKVVAGDLSVDSIPKSHRM